MRLHQNQNLELKVQPVDSNFRVLGSIPLSGKIREVAKIS